MGKICNHPVFSSLLALDHPSRAAVGLDKQDGRFSIESYKYRAGSGMAPGWNLANGADRILFVFKGLYCIGFSGVVAIFLNH